MIHLITAIIITRHHTGVDDGDFVHSNDFKGDLIVMMVVIYIQIIIVVIF